MTLDDIKGRCKIVDGHWLWAGACSDGWPRIAAPEFTRHDGRKTSQHGRRAVWHVINRQPIPAGWRVFGTCEERTCINPEHIVCEPTAKWGKRVANSGKWRGLAERITKVRAAGRKRSHLTPDLIEAILASPKTGQALTVELGLSRTVISKARCGKATAFQPVGGLFTGLLATNDSKRRAA